MRSKEDIYTSVDKTTPLSTRGRDDNFRMEINQIPHSGPKLAIEGRDVKLILTAEQARNLALLIIDFLPLPEAEKCKEKLETIVRILNS